MQTNLNVRALTNHGLVGELHTLVAQERKITRQILELIAEADRRRLYAEAGYPNIYEWLMKEFKYSEGAASRRVAAARLLSAESTVAAKVESGELSLTNLSRAQVMIRVEEKRRGGRLTPEAKAEVIELVESKSTREAEVSLAAHFPEAAAIAAKKESVRICGGDEQVQVQVVLTKQQHAKLERVREVTSHSHFGASLADLIEVLADNFLDRCDPLQREVKPRGATKPKKSQTPSDSTKSVADQRDDDARNLERAMPRCDLGAGVAAQSQVDRSGRKPIKPSVRNLIYRQGDGKCGYRDPITGRVCGSRFLVEMDHTVLVALGGTNAPENLRLRCRVHNQLEAEKVLGPEKMRQYRHS